MNFKKLLLVLCLTTMVMFSLLLGFSYAWYATATSTSFDIKTPTSDKIIVDFATSKYISTTTGVPLTEEEVPTKADKTAFTVKANSSMNMTAKYTILLQDITIDEKLKNSNFKWQLLKDETSVAIGDFANIGNSTTFDLYTTSLVLNATDADNYELRVWLHETGEVQNDLMNKPFSATVAIKTFLSY